MHTTMLLVVSPGDGVPVEFNLFFLFLSAFSLVPVSLLSLPPSLFLFSYALLASDTFSTNASFTSENKKTLL